MAYGNYSHYKHGNSCHSTSQSIDVFYPSVNWIEFCIIVLGVALKVSLIHFILRGEGFFCYPQAFVYNDYLSFMIVLVWMPVHLLFGGRRNVITKTFWPIWASHTASSHANYRSCYNNNIGEDKRNTYRFFKHNTLI